MSDLSNLLERIPPFSIMNDEQRAEACACAHHRRYEEGEFITLSGEVWPYLLLVEEGRFEAVKESPEGRSLVVVTFDEGEIFWGLAFFRDGVRMPVSIKAQVAGRVALWRRDDVLPILLSNSQALWAFCQVLVSRMERASKIVDGLAFQPVAGRLAGFLLEHYRGSVKTPVTRNLTLDEMAARVGTTREMVCRVLYRFSDQQLIDITRTELSITDEDGLARLAGEVD